LETSCFCPGELSGEGPNRIAAGVTGVTTAAAAAAAVAAVAAAETSTQKVMLAVEAISMSAVTLLLHLVDKQVYHAQLSMGEVYLRRRAMIVQTRQPAASD
jgi:hypothetical protein